MKLISLTIACLIVFASASPRRYYKPAKPSSANSVAVPTAITTQDDAVQFLESMYKKHGEQHANKITKLLKKLQRGVKQGKSPEQSKANVRAILVNNSATFGLSATETKTILDDNEAILTDFVSNIDITEVKSIANDRPEDLVEDGFAFLADQFSGSKDATKLINDVEKTVGASVKGLNADGETVAELAENALDQGVSFLKNNEDVKSFFSDFGITIN